MKSNAFVFHYSNTIQSRSMAEFHVTLLSNDSINKYPQNVLSFFTNYIETPLQLVGEWQVGISEIYLNKFNGKESKIPELEMLYVYSHIIKPRIVGDQVVRCLKVLPADPNRSQYIKFGRIEYYPIDTFYIRNISIIILDAQSKRIDFNESTIPTLVTLHFRKTSILTS